MQRDLKKVKVDPKQILKKDSLYRERKKKDQEMKKKQRKDLERQKT